MKKAIPLFAIALILVALAVFRLPETVRAVDIVSLLGAGILAGVLLMRGIVILQAE